MRAVAAHLPAGAAFVVDQSLRYLLAEGTALRDAGFTPADFEGRTVAEAVGPELSPVYEARYRQALAGEPFEVEHTSHGRHYMTHGVPLRDAQGRVVAAMAVSYDITNRVRVETARRQAEERQAFLLKLSDALRPLADPRDVKAVASRVLGEQLRVNRAFYAEIEGDDWLVVKGFEQGVAPLPDGRYSAGTFGPWIMAAYRAGERFVFRDVNTDPRFTPAQRDAHAAAAILGAVGVPLVKDGRLVAILAVHTAAPRGWTDAEIALVEETAERTWAAVEHARAESALRANGGKYRTLFDSIDEGYLLSEVIFDNDGRPVDLLFLEANPAAVRLAGRDFTGRRLREIDPHYEQYWVDIHGRVARTGEAARGERYAAPHGRWFEFHASRVDAPAGAHRVAVVYQDVTDRKLREERQAFLLKLSDTLRGETAGPQIERVALDLLAAQLSVDRAYITTADYEKGENVVPAEARRGELPPLVGVFRHADFPESARSVNEGTLVIDDVAGDPRLSNVNRQSFGAIKIGSLIGVGLRKGDGDVFWTLAVAMAGPRKWTPLEVTLMEDAAERVLSALGRADAEAALRESEERYRALFNSMDEAYAVVEAIRDESTGRWTDFLFQEVNPAFVAHTGVRDPVGKTGTQLLGTPNPRWAEVYGRVAETGVPVRMEQVEETLDRVFDLYIFRLGGAGSRRVAVLFTNVTERKRAEDALRESTVRFRSIANLVPDLLWSSRPDGYTEWFNQRWAEYTGKTLEEGIGWGWIDAIHPDDREASARRYREAVEAGRALVQEHRVRRHDGAYRWFLVRAEPVRDAAGNLTMFGSATDIHDQRAAAIVLAESEQRLRLALSAARMGIWTWDADADRHTRDAHLNALLGLPEAETVEPLEELLGRVHPDDRAAFRAALDAALASDDGMAVEFRVVLPDGSIRWLRDQGGVVHEPGGRRMSGAVVDVTERRAAEDALRASEARQAAFFEQAAVGLSELAADGRFLQVNDALCAMLGRPRDELLTLTALDVTHPEDRAATAALLARVLAHGGRAEVDKRYVCPDGSAVFANSAAVRLEGIAGAGAPRVLVVTVDLTARREAERRAREHAERYRLLVENVRDHAVFTLDPRGRVDTWNPGAERIFGFAADEIIGRTAAVMFTPEDRAAGEHDKELATAARDGRASGDRWQLRKGGARFWANGVTSAMRDADGRLVGFTKVLRDDTEAKLLADRRQQLLEQQTAAREAAEQAMRLRDEFLAIVSHELRTPLGAILLWAKLLRGNPAAGASPQVAQTLDVIVENAEAQRQLIEDLLDTSRMISGKLVLSAREVDVAALANSAAEAIRPAAAAKGVRLDLSVSTMTLSADPDRLRQVIWNVLNNAVKFTDSGGPGAAAGAADPRPLHAAARH
jgi:PAS domain S-box-containing protein